MKCELMFGDCLEKMDQLIKKGIKFDSIITDPPYGTTACKWDSIIPLDEMWSRLNQLIKPNGAIVLFGSEPFSSYLRMSNLKMFKYDWIWDKAKPVGAHVCKIRPLQQTENIIIFGQNKINYFPQMVKREKPRKGGKEYGRTTIIGGKINEEKNQNRTNKTYDFYYPKNLILFSNASNKNRLHPTQKPVELMEYLIKTYTLENETVLDFTMGSGSTGVACVNTNRNFYGIEKDEQYFEIAKNRIDKTLCELKKSTKPPLNLSVLTRKPN